MAVIPDIRYRESICASFQMDPRQPSAGITKRGGWIGTSYFTDDEMVTKTPQRVCRSLPFQKTSQKVLGKMTFLYLGGEVY